MSPPQTIVSLASDKTGGSIEACELAPSSLSLVLSCETCAAGKHHLQRSQEAHLGGLLVGDALGGEVEQQHWPQPPGVQVRHVDRQPVLAAESTEWTLVARTDAMRAA